MPVTAPRSTGHPGYSQTLPCVPESVPLARALVRTALAVWTMETLQDPSALITSELVTNVIRHTTCRSVHVAVSRPHGSLVRIEVEDRSSEAPTHRCPEDDEAYGRGLILVSALSHRWGADITRTGKTVWAELLHPAAT
jgi:serine/threonine-protein kinase RsbW